MSSTYANAYDELHWRGSIYDMTAGAADALRNEKVTCYNGFDPTATSLHIGSMVPILGLVRLQRHGHTPIAVVGGGTGMIGDPGGRAEERALLDIEQIERNTELIRLQLEQFLDFNAKSNPARLINKCRLAAGTSVGRIHAGHRQAPQRQLHAGQGVGEVQARQGKRHLVHRVQLHAVARPMTSCGSTKITTARFRWAAATSGATYLPGSN